MKIKKKLTEEELTDRAYIIAVASIVISALSLLMSIFWK